MRITLSIILCLVCANELSAQSLYQMNIKMTDNTTTSILTGDISQITFTVVTGCGTVTYGNKTYNTIIIGTQCWLRENLNIGTMIAGISDQTNNGHIEKYCYNDDSTNCGTYGGLYQWNEAMAYSSSEGAQGICPAGWHIPTQAEYTTLSDFVGNDGNALKAVGQGSLGTDPMSGDPTDGRGTNTSGFSALLAGDRWNGTFESQTLEGEFWTSSTSTFTNMRGSSSTISYIGTLSTNGNSIRCIKN
jgi:uncharacterized protein (TIGR02145 family)